VIAAASAAGAARALIWVIGRRRWRALDLGSTKAFLEAEAPRVTCRRHGVVVCAVPWARHGSRFTRAFEDQTAWLSVNTSESAVAELMRVAWRTVDAICERVCDDVRREVLRCARRRALQTVELVSCDVAGWIAGPVADRLPGPVRCDRRRREDQPSQPAPQLRDRLLAAGVPLQDVQDAMGHADPRTIRAYDRSRHNLDRHPTYTMATQLHRSGGPSTAGEPQ